jgi:hypothetical protein
VVGEHSLALLERRLLGSGGFRSSLGHWWGYFGGTNKLLLVLRFRVLKFGEELLLLPDQDLLPSPALLARNDEETGDFFLLRTSTSRPRIFRERYFNTQHSLIRKNRENCDFAIALEYYSFKVIH